MSAASDAADVASLYPIDHPLAQLARMRLDVAVRAERGPSMHKITVPNDVAIQHIGDPAEPGTCWLIYGVGYSDSPGVLAYAERTDGVTLEPVDEVPPVHLEQLARIRAYRAEHGTHVGVPMIDGESTGSRHRWPDMSGEHRDVRTVVDAEASA